MKVKKKKIPAGFYCDSFNLEAYAHHKAFTEEKNVPVTSLRQHRKHKSVEDELCSCPPPDSPSSSQKE